MSLFDRLSDGLSKTRARILQSIGVSARLSEEFYAHLEEALISADVGVDASAELVTRLRAELTRDAVAEAPLAYQRLKSLVASEFPRYVPSSGSVDDVPWVILVAGVNGVGKTTTIGKLADEYRRDGKRVMLGAADTFRAGAVEQLRIWAERTGAEFVAQQDGADPASVAYDTVSAAKARGIDVVMLDTAGRLHNKVNLMNELEKVVRVVRKLSVNAPHETLLVIDATTGQNGLQQARAFSKAVGLTGLVVTKLDGTAKGGIALAVARELHVPIRRIGVGEQLGDLQPFDPQAYAEAMFGNVALQNEGSGE
jgi:fused signal recognition particle receptor